MPVFENRAEIDAYYLADPAHAQAAGIMWPALIERRIDKLFETALRPDNKVRAEVLGPGRALGNYAVKVRLAYLVGWVEKDLYRDLLLVGKIRNRFAHFVDATDFTDVLISGWLKNMTAYQTLPGMLDRCNERVKVDPAAVNLAMSMILREAIADGQSGFRLCVDLMMTQLAKSAEHMARNLAGLHETWMVNEVPSRG